MQDDISPRRAQEMLRRGDLVELRVSVAALPRTARGLELRIADTEAKVRLQQATLADLDAVDTDLAGSEGSDPLRWWAAAIRAEYLFWKGDLLAVQIAATTLASMPDDALLPALVLTTRARLRRIVAIGRLFTTGFDSARADLDRCVEDFVRAGSEEERSLTVGLFAISRAGFFLEDFDFCETITAEACARLRTLESPQLPLLLSTLAMIRFLRGDLWGVHRALDEAAAQGDPIGVPGMVVRYLRALASMIGSGAADAAVARMDAVGDDVRLHYPDAMGTLCIGVAAVLLDFGRPADARRWSDRAALTPSASPFAGFDARVVGLRLGIHDGRDGVVEELRADLEQMVAVGLGRDAGQKALRAARDCERAGRFEAAILLRRWGLDHLPPVGHRTLWEALFAAPLRPDSAAGPPVGVRVRVLVPIPEVESSVGVTQVEGNPARLLTVLVAANGRATADHVIDRLWPGADIDAGRNRLNVTVHKLRRSTVRAGCDVIVRRGNVLELSADAVDAWDFSRGCGDAGAGERLRSLEAYADHFGGDAAAYDDAVHDERTRLAACWIDLAAGLLEDGAVAPGDLADRVASLGLEDLRLGELIAAHLADAGRHASARIVASRVAV